MPLLSLFSRKKKSARVIDCFFTMASTYTYLTAMRTPAALRASGVTLRWRPIHLLAILQEMKHVPFADKPAKSTYMWRDIERRAAMYGIPARVPVSYPPKQGIVANSVALVGLQEGWGEAFIREAYRRWFQLGQETGSDPNVSESLRAIGQSAERVMELAGSEQTRQLLLAETDEARHLGIFGSPTFVVGSELFWGDDRLDDAISWLEHGRVTL